MYSATRLTPWGRPEGRLAALPAAVEGRHHPKSGRVRSDAFSTRYKISSNRSNAVTWMARLAAARQEPERRGPESRLWVAVVERAQG
jgi:hypothetical protein